jgi:hypothetical protein
VDKQIFIEIRATIVGTKIAWQRTTDFIGVRWLLGEYGSMRKEETSCKINKFATKEKNSLDK